MKIQLALWRVKRSSKDTRKLVICEGMFSAFLFADQKMNSGLALMCFPFLSFGEGRRDGCFAISNRWAFQRKWKAYEACKLQLFGMRKVLPLWDEKKVRKENSSKLWIQPCMISHDGWQRMNHGCIWCDIAVYGKWSRRSPEARPGQKVAWA